MIDHIFSVGRDKVLSFVICMHNFIIYICKGYLNDCNSIPFFFFWAFLAETSVLRPKLQEIESQAFLWLITASKAYYLCLRGTIITQTVILFKFLPLLIVFVYLSSESWLSFNFIYICFLWLRNLFSKSLYQASVGRYSPLNEKL